jgi:hypothetical protein
MTVSKIDPIQDPRWHAFVERHPRASIFHSVGWLEALRRTYGFQAVAYTTARAGVELEDGIVFCHANSWLTGKRAISLPFSDHCQPLVDSADTLAEVISFVHAERVRQGQKFAEIRPLHMEPSVLSATPSIQSSRTYCLHTLDLSSKSEDIFKKLHKDCIQRKIRRAEKEKLGYCSDRSLSGLKDFYGLLVITRRYHGLPPQPFRWFTNLLDCLGDQLTIHIASKDGVPVAAIMTLEFNKTVTYKYGCSNPQFNNLGGMPFLFWKAIWEAKAKGASEFDLGRSDLDNRGLIDFKDRLGSTRSTLFYYRDAHTQYNPSRASLLNQATHVFQRQILPRLPDQLLIMAGRLMYKHVG